ncbi:hypothetical protein DPM18_08085 [Polynucleobacter paneuropaeus]|uniref:hypothetical protein n=1 Tax=Polynucleobacter paneuropaeus TaxID=2527775 RepID=UPI000DBF086E|nr:hypothetical protein [Polynucleobacter paneuropaeus]AWW46770.1 hypothetical protein DPM18_08085 [Polynucleobacter paneuropaeus]
MTSYSFKVELDDVDIWFLEDLLKKDIEKTFQENTQYKELSEQGSLLRSEKVLKKLNDSLKEGLKEILESENQDKLMDRYYDDMESVNSIKKFIKEIKKHD